MTFDWKTWLCILLIPLIVIGIWYAFAEDGVAPASGQPFSKEGNIIKDNPGFEPGAWYLLYEEAGAPALSVRLLFDTASECMKHGVSTRCDMSFVQGERVRIDGERKEEIVRVDRLFFVEKTPDEEGTRIMLYFYNPALDQGPGGVQCTAAGLVAVERVIPRTMTPLKDSIELLLRGEISDEERAQGAESQFPLSDVTLVKAVIENGVATLTFNDPQNKTGGGSCRISILRHQIEATAKQFPSVQSVRFAPEDLFQP